ncbi:MAG: hypothetical protein JWR68_2273 [Polaromonas sp.]|nr:hypothetical protein [Polaromonas sp.]
MEVLNIFSAGAAKAAVTRVAQSFEADSGMTVNGRYGAVQPLKARLLAGEEADVIVLTDALIEELIERKLVLAGSRADLGTVATGMAVRAGMPVPRIDSLANLRAALLACETVYCPDPAAATAGKVMVQVLRQLGIFDVLGARLQYCASGYETAHRLAQGQGPREMAVMQVTEIAAVDAIALVGPLPAALQIASTYSAGLAAHARHPDRAAEFIRRLTQDRQALATAGFGSCPQPGESETAGQAARRG